jgi:hypothetical protein
LDSAGIGKVGLAEALRLLARRVGVDRLTRESAARRVIEALAAIAGKEQEHSDAFQRTLLAATTTASPYRGTSEAGAHAWLRRTFWREASRDRPAAPSREADSESTPFAGALSPTEPDVREFVDLLHAEIRRKHVGHAGTVWAAVLCYLKAAAGEKSKEQVRALSRDLRKHGGGKDTARVRQKVYKMRYDGRRWASDAMRRLLRRRAIPLRLQRVAASLGLPRPSGPA